MSLLLTAANDATESTKAEMKDEMSMHGRSSREIALDGTVIIHITVMTGGLCRTDLLQGSHRPKPSKPSYTCPCADH